MGVGHERPICGPFGPLTSARLPWSRMNPSAIGLALALAVSEVYVSFRGDDRVPALLIVLGHRPLSSDEESEKIPALKIKSYEIE